MVPPCSGSAAWGQDNWNCLFVTGFSTRKRTQMKMLSEILDNPIDLGWSNSSLIPKWGQKRWGLVGCQGSLFESGATLLNLSAAGGVCSASLAWPGWPETYNWFKILDWQSAWPGSFNKTLLPSCLLKIDKYQVYTSAQCCLLKNNEWWVWGLLNHHLLMN